MMIDPDWAMFNMAAFTGSIYGRDFVDCKTPLIHIWYWLIAKIVGANEKRVRFVHHFILGAVGVLVYQFTGDFFMGLAYTVLINSAWLLAFHGNVGQVPASLLVLSAIVPNPWFAASAAVLSVGFNPKLLPALAILVVVHGWYVQAAVLGVVLGLAALALYVFKRQWFDWIWECSYVIPKAMGIARRKYNYYPYNPWWTAKAFLYMMPWAIAAAWAKPDIVYWLPVLAYLVFISLGMVIRPNHLIPIVPWIALSGIDPQFVLALIAIDYVSAGFYLGNLWERIYPQFSRILFESEKIGAFLRDKEGSVWVNSMSGDIYVHARKKIEYLMTEHLELNGVTERRKAMKKKLVDNPPDWIVISYRPGLKFQTRGYEVFYQSNIAKILKKVRYE